MKSNLTHISISKNAYGFLKVDCESANFRYSSQIIENPCNFAEISGKTNIRQDFEKTMSWLSHG
jgi:hypothetical protein